MTRATDNHSLTEEQSFAGLLFEITASFINIPSEQIDAAIENAQRRICEFCDFDRSSIFQWSPEQPDVFELTHVYQSEHSPIVLDNPPDRKVLSDFKWFMQYPENAPVYMRINAMTLFPWVASKIHNNETVAFSRLDDLPDEANVDREMFRKFAAKSSLIIPLGAGGELIGAISFATIRRENAWSDTHIMKLRRIALAFANVLERKRNDRFLRISEARLLLAAESADAALWNIFLDSGHMWVTDNSWDLYGIPREELLTVERFLEMVHFDDRDRVQRAIQAAREGEVKIVMEYRLLSADGTVHWVNARGRLLVNDAGEPYCLMGAMVDITERKLLEEQLQMQLREIQELKQRLEQENSYLQKEIKSLFPQGRFFGQSAVMKSVIAQAMQVAQTDTTVLILGETGTGKELLARAIYDQSNRKGRPLITVNCASLPPSLIEAELFGREKGAYTGALSRVIGRFELADNATIFLDEIGELPLDLQAKLLRVIESGSFERLGSPTPITVNLRIIAATNRDLFNDVLTGKFRSDLYYRLNVFPILIPPLRERPEDIPILVWSLVKEFQESMGKKVDLIPEKTMKALSSYDWPGNIRELKNVIERAMIVSQGSALEVTIPGKGALHMTSHQRTLEEMMREHIMAVLSSTRGQITGKGGAAEVLGLERTTLYSKMKKLGITRSAT